MKQEILLSASPWYIALCLVVSGGLAYWLYQKKGPWPVTWNYIMTGLRFVVLFALSFLLLDPIVRYIKNYFEKPYFAILYDNSGSVAEKTDSVHMQGIYEQLEGLSDKLTDNGYDIAAFDLNGEPIDTRPAQTVPATDLTKALKKISNRLEGKAIEGVIVLSDGIYNSGLSPLYSNYTYPIYTIGVGDSLQHADLNILNVLYNKIAYQGNKYPIRVEILPQKVNAGAINISLLSGGKVIDRQTKNVVPNQLMTFDFQVTAEREGIQKVDVVVDAIPSETNIKNNRATAFVEVVEGKKKILIVAAFPHPDIKALREVIEKNSNYELLLHIPGLMEQETENLRPANVDMAIFIQTPDQRGKTRELFSTFASSRSNLFIIFGQQTDFRLASQHDLPVKFETSPRDVDQVTPVLNPSFSNFSISSETQEMINTFPPVTVPFARMRLPASATPLLTQRVGSLATEKPLLLVDTQNERKVALMLGEGLWRWRLSEFDRTENAQSFDELFGKLIQFLSTTDDKRKFRSFPLRQEFADGQTVVFESQVYNDIFERVYGNAINIKLTDEQGRAYDYSYTIAPGNTRYNISGLKEGVYRFRNSTVINGKKEEVVGEFIVSGQQVELQNLTADFALLRKLSDQTGGKFFHHTQLAALESELGGKEVTGKILSEEIFDSVINMQWIFFLLLLLITLEWGARKYFGSY